MSLILSLETSVRVCSVAIHDQGKLISTREIHLEHSHASQLAVLMDEVIKESGIAINQLKAIAVSSGPGSYTGLRIGTSTAKGLCYALTIPLISIGSLELLAYQMSKRNPTNAFLCPMIDARRMEVYCQVFDASLKTVSPIEAKVIDSSSFRDLLTDKQITFFGDGSDKCKDQITDSNAKFITGIYAAASEMGTPVYEKFQKQQFEDLAEFEPHYLKEFVIKKPTVKHVN
jgi:tRNA threonylcarbamoyladenosine biosynthesis protein TsaB